MKLLSAEADLLTDLVSRRGELTIGAPTSPIVSNCIMHDFDEKWSNVAQRMSATYTRYADDIYVSSRIPNIVPPLMENIAHDLRELPGYNFFINERKTVHTSRKRLRRVTGIVITPQGSLSIGRDSKRFLRSQIFKGLSGTLSEAELQSLLGRLSYATGVEPDLLDRLKKKFGSDFQVRLSLARLNK